MSRNDRPKKFSRLLRTTGWTFVTVVFVFSTAPAGPPPPEPPPLRELESVTYGDEENVKLLSEILADPDPLMREQAVVALGQTRNTAALLLISKALDDSEANVRIAAAVAGGEFEAGKSDPIVTAALDDIDTRVVIAGIQTVARLRPQWAREKLRPLLDHRDATVQTVALEVLTDMGLAVPAEKLISLMQSRSAVLRLRAVENAMLVDKTESASLLPQLRRLAKEGRPSTRGAALAVLGKFAFSSAGQILQSSREHANPFVRRGVLEAYRLAGQADRIRAFLDDASPMVRLAAASAAGELRCADCTTKLFEMLLRVRDDQTHLACRQSLLRIARSAQEAQKISDWAAAALKKLAPELSKKTKRPKAEQELLERNVRSCCWLLGELKSAKAYDTQLALLKSLQIDSKVLIELSISLGRIGDKAAVSLLLTRLADCAKNGREMLIAIAHAMTMSPPYDKDVTIAIIEALGELCDTKAVSGIIAVANVKVARLRLGAEAAGAARTLTLLAGSENHSEIETCLSGLLEDSMYPRLARYEAARAAGRLFESLSKQGIRADMALPSLRKLLEKDRPGLITMRAAAWAIRKMTGTAPDIPDPTVVQSNKWIITKLLR